MTERIDTLPNRSRPLIGRRWFLARSLRAVSAPATIALLAACSQPAPPAPPTSAPTAAPPPPTTAPSVPTPVSAAPTAASAPKPTSAAVQPTVAAAAAAPTGTIRIGSSSEFTLMDPLTNSFLNDFNLLYVNLYDQLVVRNPDGTLGPGLAESWTLHSPTEWDFKLRQGVKFQNGEPFDASSVKFTLDRFLSEADGSPFVKPYVAGAAVVDDYTVRVTTPKPDPVFLENSVYYVFPVPPKYTAQVGRDGFAAKPVGTGPFKFVEWVKGDHLSLEQNPGYWRGTPQVQSVNIKISPEIATRVAALQAGELDLIMQLTPDQIPNLASRNARAVGAPVPRVIYLITFPDSPVGSGEPLKDKRVRQALNYGINIDSIVQNVLGGQALRSPTIVPPLAFGYDASLTPTVYDPAMAKQLLAAAGYDDGFNIDMDVPTGGNPLKPIEVGQAIAADLSKLGINVTLRTIEAASYITYRNEKKMSPIFLWNWYGYDGHLQVQGNVDPGFQFAFWNDPRTTDLLNKEATSMDPAVRVAAFKDIQQILKDEAWFVPLYQQNELQGVSNTLIWDHNVGGHVWLWDARLKTA